MKSRADSSPGSRCAQRRAPELNGKGRSPRASSVLARRKSALGQLLRSFTDRGASALPQRADHLPIQSIISSVPIADILAEWATTPNRDSPRSSHSMTLSARATNVGGMGKPRALAVLELMTSSNLVGCSTGVEIGERSYIQRLRQGRATTLVVFKTSVEYGLAAFKTTATREIRGGAL
jgi:hypothetical protein